MAHRAGPRLVDISYTPTRNPPAEIVTLWEVGCARCPPSRARWLSSGRGICAYRSRFPRVRQWVGVPVRPIWVVWPSPLARALFCLCPGSDAFSLADTSIQVSLPCCVPRSLCVPAPSRVPRSLCVPAPSPFFVCVQVPLCVSKCPCVAQSLSPCLVLFVSGFRCFQSRRHEHPSVLALLCAPVPLCPSP